MSNDPAKPAHRRNDQLFRRKIWTPDIWQRLEQFRSQYRHRLDPSAMAGPQSAQGIASTTSNDELSVPPILLLWIIRVSTPWPEILILIRPSVLRHVHHQRSPVSIPSTFSGNSGKPGWFPRGNFSEAINPNLRTPYVQQWNLSVQHEIGWNTSIVVSYVGKQGSKLYRAIDLNQVIINSNGFLNDFVAARKNGFLRWRIPQVGVFDPSYNSTIAGSQPLPIFTNNLLLQGWLSNATVQGLIQRGEAGELANFYHSYGSVYQQYTNGPTLQVHPTASSDCGPIREPL